MMMVSFFKENKRNKWMIYKKIVNFKIIFIKCYIKLKMENRIDYYMKVMIY